VRGNTEVDETPTRRIIAASCLTGAYILLTWASAVAATMANHTHPSPANLETSVHGIILAGVSILTLVFTIQLIGRRAKSDLRLRIVCGIICVALVVTAIVLPLPVWMVLGHIAGAVLLLAVTIILLLRRTRTAPR